MHFVLERPHEFDLGWLASCGGVARLRIVQHLISFPTSSDTRDRIHKSEDKQNNPTKRTSGHFALPCPNHPSGRSTGPPGDGSVRSDPIRREFDTQHARPLVRQP